MGSWELGKVDGRRGGGYREELGLIVVVVGSGVGGGLKMRMMDWAKR